MDTGKIILIYILVYIISILIIKFTNKVFIKLDLETLVHFDDVGEVVFCFVPFVNTIIAFVHIIMDIILLIGIVVCGISAISHNSGENKVIKVMTNILK